MQIIRKVIHYFYPPNPKLEAAKKDYEDYKLTKEYLEWVKVYSEQFPDTDEPILMTNYSNRLLLCEFQNRLKALEDINMTEKLQSIVDTHNRMVDEIIRLSQVNNPIEDIELTEFKKIGRKPGSKCLCH